ncbi:MAG: hypothetical protein HY319_12545 [Armatimonadetes bacterium]|nr:hypothetical protein [Armatimonadota bacterium]
MERPLPIRFFLAALMAAALLGAVWVPLSADPQPAPGPGFVYLARYGPVGGPVPGEVQSLYVGLDGLLQLSRESWGDQIHALEEKKLSDVEAFRRLAGKVPRPFRETNVSAQEGVPARLLLRSWTREHGPAGWQGPTNAIPKEIQKLAACPPGVYLRAIQVTDSELAGMKGVKFRSPSSQMLSASPELSQSLKHPYRLVPVPGGKNPFQAFHQSFVPQRSVLEVRLGKTRYQVRSLRYD